MVSYAWPHVSYDSVGLIYDQFSHSPPPKFSVRYAQGPDFGIG